MAMIIALALVMYFGFNNGLGFPRYDPAFTAMLAVQSTAPLTAPVVRPGQGAASSAAPSISNSTMPTMAPAMAASMNTAPGFWNQQYLRQMRSLQQQAMAQQTMAHHAMAQQALAQQALAAPMPLRVPLGDRTNVTAAEGPQPKRGQKSAEEELEHRHLVKALAQGLINGRERGRSAYSYCKDNCSENMRNSLDRIMKKDAALKAVLSGHNRSDPALVTEALEVLDRIIPPRDGMQA